MHSLNYSALESIRAPRPVGRLEYIEGRARGRFVFDLGALDETAFESTKDNSKRLHARLCGTAQRVVGIDNSKLVPQEGLVTCPNGQIIHADIFDLSPVVEKHGRPDLVVAGELIEHLPDTLSFLRSLQRTASLKGVEFVFSTPNACSWHNAIIGLAGRESTHRDHLQIYSYKTLRTLFSRADVELLELIPYKVRADEMIARTSGMVRSSVRGLQAIVNLLEYLTPALSGGWIGVARL